MTPIEPSQRACPDWLVLRAAADDRAREEGAAPLLAALVDHLRDRPALRVVDVGAGTGANRRFLSPRLPFEQEWVVVDHDAQLLEHPGHAGAHRVHASLRELPQQLLRLDGLRGVATVVVANALLDVLTTQDLSTLADCVLTTGGTALFSLSVTGEVRWEPTDSADHLLSTTFDDHQRRDGRPGPDAPEVLTRLLEERGLHVRTAPTPWDLPGPDGEHRELLERWLTERVEDAVAQHPSSAPALHAWHQRRRDQLASGVLRVLVDHVDLLALARSGSDGAQPRA